MSKNAKKIRKVILKKTKKLNKNYENVKVIHNNFFVNNNYYTQSINNYSQYYQTYVNHRINHRDKEPPKAKINKDIQNLISESKIENIIQEMH